MLWVFEKGIFQFFENFWVTKLKPFSGKARQCVQTYLNQNLVIGSFLGNDFGATFSWKTNVLSVWKKHFAVFCKFLSDEVETVLRKSEAKYSKLLNQNLGIGRFLENGFEATLSWKTNIASVWKEHFSVFWRFLSDEVETIFWESEAMRPNLFKSKFGHRKLPRKWFWSYLQLKNECSERLKKAFCSFLQIFEWRSWNRFAEKWGKVFKTFKSKLGHRKVLRKWFWSNLELKNECCERLKRVFFSFLQIFEWRSWNHYLGKWGKAFKTI